MEAVFSPANLKQAWRRVRSAHGAPGIDGLRIEDFPAYARDLWMKAHGYAREVVCALLMNHPVRTRMPGGVGRAG